MRTDTLFSPLTVNGTNALFHTTLNHGFASGWAVRIQDPDNLPTLITAFKGYFEIVSVTSATSFTWTFPTPPGANSPPGYRFAGLWQVGQCVLEGNIIELSLQRYGYATGISFGGSDFRPAPNQNFEAQYLFRQVVLRNNSVRVIPMQPSFEARGIQTASADKSIIEGNLIEGSYSYPLIDSIVNKLNYFGNQEPSGAPLQGFDYDQYRNRDELTTVIQDALLLSI